MRETPSEGVGVVSHAAAQEKGGGRTGTRCSTLPTFSTPIGVDSPY